MGNVRELMARLGPSTVKFNTGHGGKPDLTNQDIAAALGMVPAGLGRDLLELLHGPDARRPDIVRVFQGVTRLAIEERNRRSRNYVDARSTWGIAECFAKFERDNRDGTRRTLEILKARTSVARAALFPERLEERMPQIVVVVTGYLKGDRLSNRERASALKVSESTYRQGWAYLVDWLITEAVEKEQCAAERLQRILCPKAQES